MMTAPSSAAADFARAGAGSSQLQAKSSGSFDQKGKPLEGKLVKVIGPAGRVDVEALTKQAAEIGPEAAFLAATEAAAAAPSLQPEGQRGRAIVWQEQADRASGRYVVETFTGSLLVAAQESLLRFEPVPSEEGGFDAVWPYDAESTREFQQLVGESLEEKDYCVIQTFAGGSDAADLARALSWGLGPLLVATEQVEPELYLGGGEPARNCAWLGRDLQGNLDLDHDEGSVAPDASGGRASLRMYEFEDVVDMQLGGLDALQRCDKLLTALGSLLWPITPHVEDEERRFVAWGRTSGLVRASGANSTEATAPPATRFDFDAQDRHEGWLARRKLCLMLVVDGQGGELELQSLDSDDVTLPLERGRLVLFRHDLMEYVFRWPEDQSHVTLQAWVLDIPPEIKEREQAARVLDGPPEPVGARVNIMGVQTRYPGKGSSMEAFWNLCVAGGDGMIEVPILRWDIDVYYRPEHTIGFSMTKHGAMVSQDEIELFDNNFFGIEADEAAVMAPYHRVVMEVGYQAMHNAGHQKDKMEGWRCGVFVGDSGSDWDALCNDMGPNRFYGRSNAIACSRLSHSLGLTGPVTTAETACSSSLVALGIAHLAMRRKQPEQIAASLSTELDHALIVGVNTLIGPGSYIALSGPGMLTTRGRCFTFNDSADGFARGEGCGAIQLKMCEDSVAAMHRVAMLIGSAVNQDGRSASMTAPHGPSQQDVIKASMREAGLVPSMITIAECHGTGTALGDPIEIGALRNVMRTGRSAPILKTSTKSNIGHMEAAAGMGGLIKCIEMLRHSAGAPNIHLRSLNPHLDVTGYACHFETELMDLGTNSSLSGVSSFGFGGTNARADLWGHAQLGHRKCVAGTLLKHRSIIL
eukprot:TRINITY_DN100456_c0_g1_i1.p1 TRINITY_DN100456_c0_g1~~TRINITY_DN100456_c0_g1_i1.p1  ORF type:complete len:868 (+),score=164.76 TRINITY_DN100456_c0_g1_i1:99-2702(+)